MFSLNQTSQFFFKIRNVIGGMDLFLMSLEESDFFESEITILLKRHVSILCHGRGGFSLNQTVQFFFIIRILLF